MIVKVQENRVITVLKSLFLVKTRIWTLFHFDKYGVFRHAKPMAAVDHQHDIALPELAGRDQLTFIVLNVDLTASLTKDEHL